MNIAILGYAGQGQSAYEYWNRDGNVITICDRNTATELPEGALGQLGEDYLQGLDRFDVLIRTPALHPRDITAANPQSPHILEKVTSVTNEFLRVCPTRNIIGITGTKGKGTTSTLTTRILEAAGKRVHLGGNIGIPPLELLKNDIQPDDWVVLELANFQLIDLKQSPHLTACLMVVPEHLDWHTDMDEYIQAKQQLFRWQNPEDKAIYYAENANSNRVVSVSQGEHIPFMAEPGAVVVDDNIMIDGHVICGVSELKLLGKHNWQNACAATTVAWQVTKDVAAIRSALTSFGGLEHRLQLIAEVDGVRYYDDSFGTTPASAIVALETFTQPKVIILGGSDKGAAYDELAKAVSTNNVRGVIVIGDTGPAIASALQANGYDAIYQGGNTMPEIVQAAQDLAQSGDVVLLSTACASFGLFKNYKDRGEQFIAAVQALEPAHA